MIWGNTESRRMTSGYVVSQWAVQTCTVVPLFSGPGAKRILVPFEVKAV